MMSTCTSGISIPFSARKTLTRRGLGASVKSYILIGIPARAAGFALIAGRRFARAETLCDVRIFGRRERAPARNLESHRAENFLERIQNQHHVFTARAFTHQSYPPDLALERPETGGDLDIEQPEQLRAHLRFVDPI